RTCFGTAIGPTKLICELYARDVAGRRRATAAPSEVDRRFEQIPADAGRAFKRHERDVMQAVCQEYGIAQLLGERHRLLRVIRTVSSVALHRGVAPELSEDLHPPAN